MNSNSTRSLKTVFLLSILIVSGISVRAADVPQWVDLFNGKDLTGWVDVNTSPDTWSVKDGLLITGGIAEKVQKRAATQVQLFCPRELVAA